MLVKYCQWSQSLDFEVAFFLLTLFEILCIIDIDGTQINAHQSMNIVRVLLCFWWFNRWFPPVTSRDDGIHDDVIEWTQFPRFWPFVRGIHRSPVNSPRKGRWRGALMFSLIGAWINRWVNNRDAGGLRRHRAHYDVIVMIRFSSQMGFPMPRKKSCITLLNKSHVPHEDPHLSQGLVLPTWIKFNSIMDVQ